MISVLNSMEKKPGKGRGRPFYRVQNISVQTLWILIKMACAAFPRRLSEHVCLLKCTSMRYNNSCIGMNYLMFNSNMATISYKTTGISSMKALVLLRSFKKIESGGGAEKGKNQTESYSIVCYVQLSTSTQIHACISYILEVQTYSIQREI